MKKYKIVNKKRFCIFLTLSFIIIIAIITLLNPFNKAHSKVFEESFTQVQISQGDTLWNIALEYMPENYDVRKMVYQIKHINGMDTSFIYPEDILKIPILE